MDLISRINQIPAGGRLVLNHMATIPETVAAIDAVSTADSNRPEVISKARELKTPANILDYVHSHFTYQPDNGNLQTVRTWQRLHADKTGNCVDFTTAISALLKAAGIRHRYRVADYGKGWAHIYPVTGAGALDAVTINGHAKVGHEEPYKRKRDYMPQLAILNGPAADLMEQVTAPYIGACQKMYSGYGGAMRDAVRSLRTMNYTFQDIQTAINIGNQACDSIKCIVGSQSTRNACNEYLRRNTDNLLARVLPVGDPALTGSGGGGRPLGTSGPGSGGSTPAPTAAGATLAGIPILPLALVAGAVLFSKKKRTR